MSETNEKKFPRMTEKERERFSDPVEAAKWLLGKVICRKLPDGEIMRLYITETEAYYYEDEACYGHGGKKTDANAPLFEQAGTCCIYGEMLLISCGVEGKSDNVLIRAAGNENTYCRGPIIVCDELRLEKIHSGIDILTSDELWLEGTADERLCCQTTRVGLPESADKQSRESKHRFIIL